MLAYKLFRKDNRVLHKPLNKYCIVSTPDPDLVILDYNGNKVRFSSRFDIVGIPLKRDHLTLFNFRFEENRYIRTDSSEIMAILEGSKLFISRNDVVTGTAQYVHEVQNLLFLTAGIVENPNVFGN